MDVIDRQRRTFSEVAELYDRVRPSYPDGLVDDVLSLAGTPRSAPILEIGSGTGKATRLFARRGHPLVCVEPGAALIDVARRSLADHPDVELVCATFEDWPLREGAFSLVISAQAFHWVDPAVGYPKAARALAPGGSLAIFWNRPHLRAGSVPLEAEIAAIYGRYAGRFDPRARSSPSAEPPDAQIRASGCFEEVHRSSYPWRHVYATADYLDLQRTQSNHRLLPEAVREALLAEIGEAIDRAGGHFPADYTAELYVARRRD